MNESEARELVRLIEKSQAFDWPCIVCKEPTKDRGLFVPHEPQQWGSLPGKGRVMIYGICGKCEKDTQGVERELTKKISEEMDAMRTANQPKNES